VFIDRWESYCPFQLIFVYSEGSAAHYAGYESHRRQFSEPYPQVSCFCQVLHHRLVPGQEEIYFVPKVFCFVLWYHWYIISTVTCKLYHTYYYLMFKNYCRTEENVVIRCVVPTFMRCTWSVDSLMP